MIEASEGVISESDENNNRKLRVVCYVNKQMKEIEVTREKVEEIVARETFRITSKKSREILEELGLRMPKNNYPRHKPAFLIVQRAFPQFDWGEENGKILEGYPRPGMSLATVTLIAALTLLGRPPRNFW